MSSYARHFLGLALLTFTAVAILLASLSAAAATRPNIVFILADDMGWGDVGYHNSQNLTPNLDRLAASSVRLENFHVSPMCSPTRASFLLGKPAFLSGLSTDVFAPWSRSGLPEDEPTIAHKLKGLGYRNALIGKWHLGHTQPSQRPLAKGFDYQFGSLVGIVDYFEHTFEESGIHDLYRNEQAVDMEGYLTDLLALEAENYILNHDTAAPLFLFLPLLSPHYPFQATAADLAAVSHIQNEEERVYAAMIYALDRAVGTVIKALKKRGMWQNTLLVFTSDNGPDQDGGGSSTPLREGKRSNYEGGLRTPAIVSFPDRLSKLEGHQSNSVLKITDLTATFLQAACDYQCAELSSEDADGVDIIALLEERATVPAFRVLHLDDISAAFTYGNYKAIQNALRRKEPDPANDPVEIFDIVEDPGENIDLSNTMPELVARFENDIGRLRATMPTARVDPDVWKKSFRWSTIPTGNWLSGNIDRVLYAGKTMTYFYSPVKLIGAFAGALLSLMAALYFLQRKIGNRQKKQQK